MLILILLVCFFFHLSIATDKISLYVPTLLQCGSVTVVISGGTGPYTVQFWETDNKHGLDYTPSTGANYITAPVNYPAGTHIDVYAAGTNSYGSVTSLTVGASSDRSCLTGLTSSTTTTTLRSTSISTTLSVITSTTPAFRSSTSAPQVVRSTSTSPSGPQATGTCIINWFGGFIPPPALPNGECLHQVFGFADSSHCTGTSCDWQPKDVACYDTGLYKCASVNLPSGNTICDNTMRTISASLTLNEVKDNPPADWYVCNCGAPTTGAFPYCNCGPSCQYNLMEAPDNLRCNQANLCTDGGLTNAHEADSNACLSPAVYAKDSSGVIQAVMDNVQFVTCNGSLQSVNHCGISSFSTGTTTCSCNDLTFGINPCNLTNLASQVSSTSPSTPSSPSPTTTKTSIGWTEIGQVSLCLLMLGMILALIGR